MESAPLCGWGSSAAQRNGGRVRAPAPTRMQGRTHFSRRGRSQTSRGRPLAAHLIRHASRDTFPFRGRCPRRGRMRYPVFRTRHVGSATPGAVVESHQLQFSKNPGPSGPEEIAESHSDFARRKCLPGSRGNSRNRGPGSTPPIRGRWPEGPEGVGWQSYGPRRSEAEP